MLFLPLNTLCNILQEIAQILQSAVKVGGFEGLSRHPPPHMPMKMLC